MKINVKVKPRSRKNEVKQLSENSYEIRVAVPPEKGKANEKVIELLAEHLHIPKSRFEIVKGLSSREKIIRLNF